ncbi:MAG: hypothetical protein KF743_12285 [Fimbriimonadaceae bacterium]|nr:hypothetical protein [Fimbriimonadaceae bacterium]
MGEYHGWLEMRDVEARLGISRWTVLRKCKSGDFKWRFGSRNGHRVKLIHVSSLPVLMQDSKSSEVDAPTLAGLVDSYLRTRYVLRSVPGVGKVLVDSESAVDQPMRMLRKLGVLEVAEALLRRELLRRAAKLWSFYGYARNKRTGVPRLLTHLNTEVADIYRAAVDSEKFRSAAGNRLASVGGHEQLLAEDAVLLLCQACKEFGSGSARARLGPSLGFFRTKFDRADLRRLTHAEERLLREAAVRPAPVTETPRAHLVPQVCAELAFRLDRCEPRWRNLLAVAPNPALWLAGRVFPKVDLDSLAPDIAPQITQQMVDMARGIVESSQETEDAEPETEDLDHLSEPPEALPAAGEPEIISRIPTFADLGWTEQDIADYLASNQEQPLEDPQS